MNSKRKKVGRHPKLDASTPVESQSIAVPSAHPETVQKPTITRETLEAAVQMFAPGAAAKKLTRNPKLDVTHRFDGPKLTTQGSTDSQAVNKSLSSIVQSVDSSEPTTQRSDSRVVNKSWTPSELSDRGNKAFAKWMKEVSGTDQKPLQDRLLYQATCAVTDYFGKPLENMEYAAAAMHGIKPQDGLEGLLATQMVGMHTLAMEFMFRAALKDQTDLGVEVNLNRAVKASSVFEKLTDALNRYRGKDGQKMTVEHVHVHKGGQAIVGAVSQSNTQNNPKVRSGGDDSQ